LGFPKDIDAYGNEVVRDAGISQETLQRSKWLNHSYQIGERTERIESMLADQRRKATLAKEKANLQVQAVRDIRNKLSNILFQNNCTDTEDLSNISLEELDKHLNKDELGEFILAHDPNVTKKAQIPKNKGTLKDAKLALENDTPRSEVNNRILWAWECRDQPNKLAVTNADGSNGETVIESFTPNTANPNNVRMTIAEVEIETEENGGVQPSDLLNCNEWLTTACELFRVDMTIADRIDNITQEDKDKADLLVRILRGRMNAFMKKRNVSKDKRSHWAIRLADKNLSFVAAYMVLVDHVKTDISCLDETQSLLTPNHYKFLLCQSFNEFEGAYLYYDNNHGRFIRSGKVCGRGFGARHAEHLREAGRETNPKSNFYVWYPTKDNVRSLSKSKRGVFESLTQYIAGGFDPNCTSVASVDKNYVDGGVMILEECDKLKIRSSMRQNPDLMIKFRSFLAYQLELGYDLAIAPSDNVSGSFGFESFVGLFC
jgi:hypothetical protein